jgi:hypothetical protein
MGLKDKLNDLVIKNVFDKLFNEFDIDHSGTL